MGVKSLLRKAIIYRPYTGLSLSCWIRVIIPYSSTNSTDNFKCWLVYYKTGNCKQNHRQLKTACGAVFSTPALFSSPPPTPTDNRVAIHSLARTVRRKNDVNRYDNYTVWACVVPVRLLARDRPVFVTVHGKSVDRRCTLRYRSTASCLVFSNLDS